MKQPSGNPHQKDTFDYFAWEAVDARRRDEFEQSERYAQQAYESAPNKSEAARMARDTALSLAALERYDEARAWAAQATIDHATLHKQAATRTSLRERAASEAALGRVELQSYLADPTRDHSSLAQPFREAQTHLQQARQQASGINRLVDQYDINSLRRASVAESLAGYPLRGARLGMRAVGLAFWSESPQLDTTNHQLTHKDRWRTKQKALRGSLAAIATSALVRIHKPTALRTARTAATT